MGGDDALHDGQQEVVVRLAAEGVGLVTLGLDDLLVQVAHFLEHGAEGVAGDGLPVVEGGEG